MNEVNLLIKLIDDDMINVNALLIKNYKKLEISEKDIIVLSTLARLEIKGNHLFTIERIKEKTALDKDDFFNSLEVLMSKNYLKIVNGINPKSGKQVELFYLDGLYRKLVEIYIERIRKENEKKNHSFEEKISLLFEKTFERPLQPSDADIIRRWAQEASYTYEEIENEIYEAKKLAKFSLKYVDSRLVRSHLEKDEKTAYTNNSKLIQELSEKWKK